jgi:hypothetical protein
MWRKLFLMSEDILERLLRKAVFTLDMHFFTARRRSMRATWGDSLAQ